MRGRKASGWKVQGRIHLLGVLMGVLGLSLMACRCSPQHEAAHTTPDALASHADSMEGDSNVISLAQPVGDFSIPDWQLGVYPMSISVAVDSVDNPNMRGCVVRVFMLGPQGAEYPLGSFSLYPANKGGTFRFSLEKWHHEGGHELHEAKLRLRLEPMEGEGELKLRIGKVALLK